MQQPGYDFSSEENSSKWRGLFVPALRKVRIIHKIHTYITVFTISVG